MADTKRSKTEEEAVGEEEEEAVGEDEEDKNDVVYQFLDKLMNKKLSMYVSTGAFDAMCGTSLKSDSLWRVSPSMYWAYGELQLVWRDVLEKLADCKYKPKTVTDLDLEKTNEDNFVGTFTYNDTKFFVDCVGKKWTLCLIGER